MMLLFSLYDENDQVLWIMSQVATLHPLNSDEREREVYFDDGADAVTRYAVELRQDSVGALSFQLVHNTSAQCCHVSALSFTLQRSFIQQRMPSLPQHSAANVRHSNESKEHNSGAVGQRVTDSRRRSVSSMPPSSTAERSVVPSRRTPLSTRVTQPVASQPTTTASQAKRNSVSRRTSSSRSRPEWQSVLGEDHISMDEPRDFVF